MATRACVVTGIGVVAPTGVGVGALWSAACEGRTSTSRVTRFDANSYPCQVAGEVRDEWIEQFLDSRIRRTCSRATQLALCAAELAVGDANVPRSSLASESAGVIVGTALGGWADAEHQAAILFERGPRRVNPFLAAGAANHGSGAEIAARFLARGPHVTISSGCASSTQALAYGSSLIENGQLDICIAGGTEAPVFPGNFSALCRTNELATAPGRLSDASRPFDAEHSGIVLAEGSCFLILESADHAYGRGVRPYALILGGSSSCDAQGLYQGDESGQVGAAAIGLLLKRTGRQPNDIGYVSAHANSSPYFDRKEISVLRRALGKYFEDVPISSIKGILGHPFGASGAFQAATASLAIRNGIIPPTANLQNVAPGCEARHVIETPIQHSFSNALITSYGYGGVNAYLLLSADSDGG